MYELNELKKMVKAGQTWISADGIAYTVVSNKIESKKRSVGAWPHGYSVWTETDLNVTAYTHDLSVEDTNGKINGKKCHWVNMWTHEFVEKFSKR